MTVLDTRKHGVIKDVEFVKRGQRIHTLNSFACRRQQQCGGSTQLLARQVQCVSTAVVTVVALTGLEVIQVHKQSSCHINPCDNVHTCVRAHENTRVYARLHATRHRIEDGLFFVLDVAA